MFVVHQLGEWRRQQMPVKSIALDAAVDVADKGEGREETNSSEHEESAIADHAHVPKEEGSLHETCHMSFEPEVIEAIGKDKEACRSSAEDAPPPPPVVLHRQLEVCQGDGDEGGNDDEDKEDEEEDPVEGVELPAPHRGEDIVELDVNGAEGEEPSHHHLVGCLSVPVERRNLSRKFVGSARSLKRAREVSPRDSANDVEREADES
mmetsp:Transcript_41825/g.131894  ORF Transcript_41825/g.131894 Transcript_41825/m.131894 type:complete len:207 (-) Transcript_41825:1194-1814(-)